MPSSGSFPRRIAILGCTGSIGRQTIDVVRQHPDKLQVVALAAGTRVDGMLQLATQLGVSVCAAGGTVQSSTPVPAGVSLEYGAQAVASLVRLPEVDVVVNALVGAAGLQASYDTLKAGKVLALANKESLVVGGDLIMPLAQAANEQPGLGAACGTRLLSIDSEHGAIYQCLIGEPTRHVARLWVTASGGPFRGCSIGDLRAVTPEQALAHPTWNMGPKISIDSSTLMNKGLEVIEAHHLFDMPYDCIEVVVQPQSAVHSMVEFVDGSVKAHLGTTDMRIPIQFALSYPERWDAPVAPMDFRQLGSLEFSAPDERTFRCLALARAAGQAGGTLPCAMNAANEVAVASFLAGECSYLGIADTVEAVMNVHDVQPVTSLEQLAAVDAWARETAVQRIQGRA